jgi:hypothetical protein
MDWGLLWAEVVIKRLPLFEGIDSKVVQKLEEFWRIHFAALRREILARNARAMVSSRFCDSVAIQGNRRLAVKPNPLMPDLEILFHVANRISDGELALASEARTIRMLPRNPLGGYPE